MTGAREGFAGGALELSGGPVATLLLNRPSKRNAISAAMWSALPELCTRIAGDETIRVVVVRGAGGTFSAGADIGEFEAVYADPVSTRRYNEAVRAGQAALRHLPRPVLAQIEGACVGGGCGIALACDLRFASVTARFAITPARLGLAYSMADTAQLVEKVGPAAAKDILFSGRMLSAEEAKSIGLIDRVFAADALEAEVLSYAEDLSALSQTSIRAAKTIINALSEPAPHRAAEMAALFESSFEGPDFQEGFRAFLDKRTPRFR